MRGFDVWKVALELVMPAPERLFVPVGQRCEFIH
jgi:hypothetical protein